MIRNLMYDITHELILYLLQKAHSWQIFLYLETTAELIPTEATLTAAVFVPGGQNLFLYSYICLYLKGFAACEELFQFSICTAHKQTVK